MAFPQQSWNHPQQPFQQTVQQPQQPLQQQQHAYLSPQFAPSPARAQGSGGSGLLTKLNFFSTKPSFQSAPFSPASPTIAHTPTFQQQQFVPQPASKPFQHHQQKPFQHQQQPQGSNPQNPNPNFQQPQSPPVAPPPYNSHDQPPSLQSKPSVSNPVQTFDNTDWSTAHWSSLIEFNAQPPNLTPQFENLLLGIAEYLLCVDAVDHSPSNVISPAKMAMYYTTTVGSHPEYLAFFQHSLKAPTRLTNLYSTLSVEYVLFHSISSSSNPSTQRLIPALTPRGFLRWSLLQILMFPDVATNLICGFLSSGRTIRNPSNELPYRLASGFPRSALPAGPHAETVSKYSSIWRKHVDMQEAEPESEEAKNQRLLREAQAAVYERERETKKVAEDLAVVKRVLLERDQEVFQAKKEAEKIRGLVGEARDDAAGLRRSLQQRDDELTRITAEKDTQLKEAEVAKASLHSRDAEIRRLKEDISHIKQETREQVQDMAALRVTIKDRDVDLQKAHDELRKVNDLNITIKDDVKHFRSISNDLRRDLDATLRENSEIKSMIAKRDNEIQRLNHQLKVQNILPTGAAAAGNEEISLLRNSLDATIRENSELKGSIAAQESEIQRLNHQIKSQAALPIGRSPPNSPIGREGSVPYPGYIAPRRDTSSPGGAPPYVPRVFSPAHGLPYPEKPGVPIIPLKKTTLPYPER